VKIRPQKMMLTTNQLASPKLSSTQDELLGGQFIKKCYNFMDANLKWTTILTIKHDYEPKIIF